MANEQLITITGRLTEDPAVRFVPSGGGVANFTIAFTPSKFDRDASTWKDGTPTFWRCAAWDQGKLQRAQNIGDQLKKGDNVVAQGVLETRNWEDKEGNKRSSIELNVKSIGKDLTFHGQAYAGNQAPQNGNQQQAQQQPAVGWGGQQTNAGGWGNGNTGADNSPPF
jgi:single-strand DNA-binding protein